MKRTKSIIYASCLVLFGALQPLGAVPALPQPITVVQPDGSRLTLLLRGDEFHHRAFTMDGYAVRQDDAGCWRYALSDVDGRLRAGSVMAKNFSSRSNDELSYLAGLPKGNQLPSVRLENALSRRLSSRTSMPVGLRSAGISGSSGAGAASTVPLGLLASYPTTGSPKSIVILVNFSDQTFQSANNASVFSDMLNQEGYVGNGHNGSVRDFYRFNSNGTFSPDFVVVGPVTIPQKMAYYGGNDTDGNDLHPAQMVYEACVKADSLVDFSQFDYDNDGEVDNVYVFYAGKGEADGGSESTIWPHSWSLSSGGYPLIRDGKRINAYACSAELDGQAGSMTAMGTFAHEYGHILGLTDMYDVDYDTYNGEAFDLNYWSLMAYGAYNNDSRTPPCLTLPERYLLGWTVPTELDAAGTYSLPSWESSGKGYILRTANAGEYYLLENRQTNGSRWDLYLQASGMLVYHMDLRQDASMAVNYWGTTYTMKFSEMWTYNMVNAVADHQCCDLVEADRSTLLYDGSNATAYLRSLKGDPFPGSMSVRKFTDASSPSMRTWSGTYLAKPIEDIALSGTTIQFKFKDFSAFDAAPATKSATSVAPYSFTARWGGIRNASGYYLDLYTLDQSVAPPVRHSVENYDHVLIRDTSLSISVTKDKTTYLYRLTATNDNGLTSPISDSMSVTTTDATPVALPATTVEQFSFKANWQIPSYASGVYLDVFSIGDGGDTTFLDGYHEKYLNSTGVTLNELEDLTTYRYRVKATNGLVLSSFSPEIAVTTPKASDILMYVKDRTLWLKGMDKGGRVDIYHPDGKVSRLANVNHIPLPGPGIYLVSAAFDGKVKHLKVLVP